MTDQASPIQRLKQRILHRLAASHIAGPSIADALSVCRKVQANGWTMTICPWTDSQTSPESALRLYIEAIRSITDLRLDCHLSVKTPALHDDAGKVRALVEAARPGSVYLHFDAHGPETADPTFRLVEETLKVYPHVGCTLPSRWRRSVDDAQRVREMGIGVRLVKGQWGDPQVGGIDARRSYIAVAEALRGSAGCVSVATHDVRLAQEALRTLRESNLRCELELLFSLPLGIRRVAQSLKVPIRIYTPYGHAYLPYNITHVRTRPGIAIWALKNFIMGGAHPRLEVNPRGR